MDPDVLQVMHKQVDSFTQRLRTAMIQLLTDLKHPIGEGVLENTEMNIVQTKLHLHNIQHCCRSLASIIGDLSTSSVVLSTTLPGREVTTYENICVAYESMALDVISGHSKQFPNPSTFLEETSDLRPGENTDMTAPQNFTTALNSQTTFGASQSPMEEDPRFRGGNGWKLTQIPPIAPPVQLPGTVQPAESFVLP